MGISVVSYTLKDIRDEEASSTRVLYDRANYQSVFSSVFGLIASNYSYLIVLNVTLRFYAT